VVYCHESDNSVLSCFATADINYAGGRSCWMLRKVM